MSRFCVPASDKCLHTPGNAQNPRTPGASGTAFEQPLHPKADSEEGRPTLESRLDRYTPLVTQRTRRGEVANPWNDDATGLCELRRDNRRSHVSPNRGKCLAD